MRNIPKKTNPVYELALGTLTSCHIYFNVGLIMFPISPEGKWFRFLMVFIFLAAAMETDIYLPTFPDLLKDFHTNEAMVQRILSYNFIGICIGSLLYGPLSDHFGRRPILMFGFGIFVVSSVGCIFATNIEQLIGFRLM